MKKTPTAQMPSGTPTAQQNDNGTKYQSPHWRRVSRKIRSDNAVCQRILNVGLYHNEQCHNASQMVHHRRGAIAHPELFLSVYDRDGVSNLIALCWGCHVDFDGTDGTNGTPLWVEGVDFVRTEYQPWRVGQRQRKGK